MTDYTLTEAAKFLGIKPGTLKNHVYGGRIEAQRKDGGLYFSEASLKQYREHSKPQWLKMPAEAQREIFDAKYGTKAHESLLASLKDPLIPDTEIAKKFGVSKETAGEWRNKLYPAQTGKGCERLHIRAIEAHRKRLLQDDLFASFYRIASSHLPQKDIEFIPLIGGGYLDGFRRRAVKLKDKKVLLKRARRFILESRHGDMIFRYSAYTLPNSAEPADHLFCHLEGENFLCMTKHEVPAHGTTFVDSPRSKYYKFKNNFSAL